MIYGPFDFQLYFSAALFAIVTIVTFYLPGSFIVSHAKLKSPILHYLLSNVLGIVLWAVQGCIFGFFDLRWLTYLYIITFLAIGVFQFSAEMQLLNRAVQELRRANKFAIALMVAGVLFQFLAIGGSGLRYDRGVGFYNTNAVDGTMHLAFIQAIIRQFPPQQPGAYNLALTNYHLWSDLVMADLVRVWNLPVMHVFFQYIPLYISFLTGLSAYLLVRVWKGSRAAGMWSLFLLFFAAEATFIFMLLLHQRFGFFIPSIDSGVTQFLNIPHTFAKLIFLTAMIPFSFWMKKNSRLMGAIAIFMLLSLVGFKVYFGIFAAVGLSFVVAFKFFRQLYQDILKNQVLKQKKRQNILKVVVSAVQKQSFSLLMLGVFAIFSAAIYFPTNKQSGGLFFSPLEWPKIFLGPENLNWQWWWLRRELYTATHRTFLVWILDLMAMVVGLVCIYGTRLLGFFPSRKLYQQLGPEIVVFFVPTTLIFTLLGLFTLQHSGLFNVFNFFAVSVVWLSLASAFLLAEIEKLKKPLAYATLTLFVLLTVPRSLSDANRYLVRYFKQEFEQVISGGELEALHFIKKNTPYNAIVQSHYRNFLDTETPYVSAFTDRMTYFTGGRMMETHGHFVENRYLFLKEGFAQWSSKGLSDYLNMVGVDYLYLRKHEDEKIVYKFDDLSAFEVLFENDSAMVLKVVKRN